MKGRPTKISIGNVKMRERVRGKVGRHRNQSKSQSGSLSKTTLKGFL